MNIPLHDYRYDYRPYLYNGFEYQFHKMGKLKEQIMMSNITKNQKAMNLRHAFVEQVKDNKRSNKGISALGGTSVGDNDTLRDVHVPQPFEFAGKDASGDGKAHTPDPEPNFE